MPGPLPVLFLLATILFATHPVNSLRPHLLSSPPNPCAALPSPLPAVRSDQLTVLINGYSPSRIPLLLSLAASYSSSPSVASVVILWSNPHTTTQTLTLLLRNLSLSSPSKTPISLLRQPSPSLNLRFLPLPPSLLRTRAVLVADDDVSVDPKSLEFAFKVWKQNQNRLVGLFARSHDIDLESRSWIYTVHPDKYSIMLTKFVILKSEFLYRYSCGGGREMEEARGVVDRMRNCEDILMNFVAAEEGGVGPVLVGVEKVRDWGDARNEGAVVGGGEDGEGVREVGLSSRRRDHRKRRGECIREFHRILGRMPLRYSYGKVVNSVGEQGLCEKGGKLVFCDQQVAE
ncbi:glycosyltransferase family protein 64 C3 [Rhododendron vialii]|uniref:glycosyltransferase family protein 64 C3 n=1 Tax=Rhododendron vialii TaxID=182163 RepID=UPI00265EE51E|nr:glycosyltransferase family protein 64 C3 [Rhododendron vialii]